jgi:uncharacterized cupin superfamily protein
MNISKTTLHLISSILFFAALSAKGEVPELVKVGSSKMGIEIFNGPNVEKYKDDFGADAFSITSLTSSDKKFYTGLYKSGPVVEKHLEQDYGDDEFMYLLSGSITMKSISGKAVTVKAGDAISMPKEWRGTWHSEGYTKLWVIYNPAYAEEE